MQNKRGSPDRETAFFTNKPENPPKKQGIPMFIYFLLPVKAEMMRSSARNRFRMSRYSSTVAMM